MLKQSDRLIQTLDWTSHMVILVQNKKQSDSSSRLEQRGKLLNASMSYSCLDNPSHKSTKQRMFQQ